MGTCIVLIDLVFVSSKVHVLTHTRVVLGTHELSWWFMMF
jgi:hypothetical protein